MSDLFGLGGVFSDLAKALEVVGGTIVTVVLLAGVILMATRHKSGAGVVITGLVALILLIIVAGPAQAYLHTRIHG